MLQRVVGCAALVTVAACSSAVESTGSPPPQAQPQPQPEPTQGSRYPGSGFIVHEWGTDTIVVGSDGSMQRGLHHEEEGLPDFVFDRMKAGTAPGSTSIAVDVKMETPVTYFYSDQPVMAAVAIDFPKGVFTQWYPAVRSFHPPIMGPNSAPDQPAPADPVLDPGMLSSQACIEKYGHVGNGLLDWGVVEVLPRGERGSLPDAPLEQYTWSHARAVDANDVRVSDVPGAGAGQDERFLFYRGLGNFDLPVRATTGPEGTFALENEFTDAVGTVFLVRVEEDHAAFKAFPDGIAPGATLEGNIDASLYGAQSPLDEYVDSLSAAVTSALDATGLYHDESVAMVNTWKRQWFKTPGLRVLYIAPQTWTDQSIPLHVITHGSGPQEILRVMVMRVELLTPTIEQEDVAWAEKLDGADPAGAEAHFLSLGRFAEPRLRRALSLLAEPAYGAELLGAIASAETRVAAGE